MKTKRNRGRPPHDDVLTRAEWSVVHAVQHGMTNKEIAKRRGISSDGVKFHINNAMGKLGVPNRKALRQWFQPPKGSALGAHDSPTIAPIKLGQIGQIARSVKDVKASEAWYVNVLGLPHLYTFGTFAFFDCEGVRLLLSQSDAEPLPVDSIIYLRVDNIRRAHEELHTKGVEFLNAPHLIHRHTDGSEEWMAFFKDLEGRPLAIMSLAKPPAGVQAAPETTGKQSACGSCPSDDR
jgi:DNA-binding CsgD family transcriptional regulator/catechol 2,3-dioxygenase-like lactoylglutathione lyase family enzyme